MPCTSLVFGWALGGPTHCFPQGVAMLLPASTPFILLEIHYDNPDALANETDSSGFSVSGVNSAAVVGRFLCVLGRRESARLTLKTTRCSVPARRLHLGRHRALQDIDSPLHKVLRDDWEGCDAQPQRPAHASQRRGHSGLVIDFSLPGGEERLMDQQSIDTGHGHYLARKIFAVASSTVDGDRMMGWVLFLSLSLSFPLSLLLRCSSTD